PNVILHANEEMVETVVENVLDNALSFSPEGESVGIRLETREGMAELLIGDAGPGVADEDLERIFERYFSQRPARAAAKEQDPHFAVGLWTARRNVGAPGAPIQAETRRPHGLLVRVAFPLAEGQRLSSAATKARRDTTLTHPGAVHTR